MGYGVWCCADGHRQRNSYSGIISCIKQVEVEAVAVIDDGMGIDFFHIKNQWGYIGPLFCIYTTMQLP